jgi:hypothetical protein
MEAQVRWIIGDEGVHQVDDEGADRVDRIAIAGRTFLPRRFEAVAAVILDHPNQGVQGSVFVERREAPAVKDVRENLHDPARGQLDGSGKALEGIEHHARVFSVHMRSPKIL